MIVCTVSNTSIVLRDQQDIDGILLNRKWCSLYNSMVFPNARWKNWLKFVFFTFADIFHPVEAYKVIRLKILICENFFKNEIFAVEENTSFMTVWILMMVILRQIRSCIIQLLLSVSYCPKYVMFWSIALIQQISGSRLSDRLHNSILTRIEHYLRKRL